MENNHFKKKKMNQKSDVIRLVGLFMVVYGLFCFISGGIGKVLSVPYTFLFGFASIFMIIATILVGAYMVVSKSLLTFEKKSKYIYLSLAFLFFLMLITVGKKQLNIGNVFQSYLGESGVYKYGKGFLDYDSSNGSIVELNGGIIGYLFFALLNSLFPNHYGISLGLTIALFSVFTIIFAFSYCLNFSIYCYRKYNDHKLKKSEPKENRVNQKEVFSHSNNNQEPIKFNVDKPTNQSSDGLLVQTEFQIEGEDVTISHTIKDKNTRLGQMINEFDEEIYDNDKPKPNTTTRNDNSFSEGVFFGDEIDNDDFTQENENIANNEIDERVKIDTGEISLNDIDETKQSNETVDSYQTNQVGEANFESQEQEGEKVDFMADFEEKEESNEDNPIDNQQEEVSNTESEETAKEDQEEESENQIDGEEEEVAEVKTPKVDLYNANYELPPLYLLKESTDNGANAQNEEIAKEKAEILLEKMRELNVQASISAFVVGPSVTRFEITLSPGVRVSSFTNLQEDFKLALGVNSIRIESPIPGKSAIGIEVPNKYRAMVSMKEIITKMPNKKEKLYVPVGKDITGNPLSFPICNMPHCLISGATNSGKSVCANTIILSLLMNYKPSEVRMIMVDPKRVEMLFYTDIPHLLCPIITDAERARVALDKLCDEMNKRFTTYATVGVKNIASYNELMVAQNKHKMPFILLVVDEFAELMLCKNHNIVEEKIQKLAQLGRAAGIHLILSTQRPDVNVIPGTIKTNLPCRMTFRLSSLVDSRTVIDVGGAEKLLNNGDMLLLTPDFTGLRRVQGVYVSDSEIADVVSYCKKQMGPQYDPVFLDLRTEEEKAHDEELKYALNQQNGNSNDVVSKDEVKDDLYEQIKDFVIKEQKASTSFLQRKFSIGYSKAARMIDMLEEEGVVGPENGSKPREVLVSTNNDDNQEDFEDYQEEEEEL